MLLLEHAQPFLAISRFDALELCKAGLPQVMRKKPADLGLVVYDEDGEQLHAALDVQGGSCLILRVGRGLTPEVQ